VNLADVAEHVRNGEDIAVEDATSGQDLTKEVLLAVALETLNGADILPASLLRRIIRSTGTSAAEVAIRTQLGAGLDFLCTQLDRLEALFPLPRVRETRQPDKQAPTPTPRGPDREMEALRERLAELEARLGR
jgi:hypothetical protein